VTPHRPAIADYEVPASQCGNRTPPRATTRERRGADATGPRLGDYGRPTACAAVKSTWRSNRSRASEARIREQQQAVDNCTIPPRRTPGICGFQRMPRSAKWSRLFRQEAAFTRNRHRHYRGSPTPTKLRWTSANPISPKCRPTTPVTAILDAYPDWSIPPRKVRTVNSHGRPTGKQP